MGRTVKLSIISVIACDPRVRKKGAVFELIFAVMVELNHAPFFAHRVHSSESGTARMRRSAVGSVLVPEYMIMPA